MSERARLRVSDIAEIVGAIGLVEQRIWRGFERQIREVSQLPGVQQWWSVRSDWFSGDFQDYVHSHIADGDAAAPVDYAGTECSTTS
ncbi:MAG: hypothetical protein OEU49_08765 [Chromatiales bacterium]|jgi:hypothetical protein|nr:hypothetical protein [Chromatiales bacterium]MDH4030926.1 hypothetical protein [Chromatiales bacterium]